MNKRLLLIVLCPILLLLSLSLGQVALAVIPEICPNTKPTGCDKPDAECNSDGWCGCTAATVPAKGNFSCMAESNGEGCIAFLCPGAASNKCCKPATAGTDCSCQLKTECPNAIDQIVSKNDTCKTATEYCCKPLCASTNCREKCDGTFDPDLSKSTASCPIGKKACCKPKGGTTDPSTGGGKTEGGTYPLAPLSPVGDINIPTLIGYIIKGVLGIVGSIALLMFVYGGFLMLISQGDAAKIKKGKDALVWAAAGLVVIFGSYIFVNYILTAISKGGA